MKKEAMETNLLDQELSTEKSTEQDQVTEINIDEQYDNTKERPITGHIVPVISVGALYIAGRCDTTQISANKEISEKIIEYIKHVGSKTAFIIITYKFKALPEDNELLQVGMLAEIKGVLEEKDKKRSILFTPKRMVRFKKLEAKNQEIIVENADGAKVFISQELFFAEIEVIKYHISDITKLKKLVQQAKEIALNREFGNLYIGKQEWRISLDLEYIARVSELLCELVSGRCNDDELARILYNPNLNHRYEEIIRRLKEKRLEVIKCVENVREVSEIPAGYKILIKVSKDTSRWMSGKYYSNELYIKHFEEQGPLILSKLDQYQQEGVPVICTAIEFQDYKNNTFPAVLGRISHIKWDDNYTVLYVKPLERVEIKDLVYCEGFYYGKVEVIAIPMVGTPQELIRLKELVDQVIQLYYRRGGGSVPVYIEGEKRYEEYAEDISYHVMARAEIDSEDFVNKSIKEKLEYLVQHMLPVGISDIYEYEKLHYNLKMYEEVINSKDSSNDSDNAGAYNGRGATLSKLGKYEEAIKDFTQAIALKPDYATGYHNKAVALQYLERYEEAIQAFDKAIELKPDDAETIKAKQTVLAKMMRKTSDKSELATNDEEEKDENYWQKQLENYNQQIKEGSKSAELYLCKGNALNKLENYEEAIVVFDKAIEIKSDFETAYNCKGYALHGLKKYEEAIAAFEKAIELDHDYADAYNGRGATLSKLGKYEEAIVEYDRVIELMPNAAVPYAYKGNTYIFLKQYDEALKWCNKAIELDPNYADAYIGKGTTLHQLGKYEEAIVEYDKAIALKPHFQEALDNKKAALEAIARQASNKDFEILLKNTPLSPVARKVAEQKIARLKGSQGSNDGDRSYTEKYLNYLFRLPWGKFDEASIDIIEAEKILDQNHYGLESVKQKIIESLAFMATSKDAKPPILCLVGAPGVGKTSIAQVISKALNRRSVTLSLAGARDEGLIRGCMDFYVGAKPGKVLSLLSEVGSSNPVMILDEIDKISKERGSALEGALLQLIDPSQNDSFTDDYFDFGCDMSKVFFIATANSIDNIPYPLLHRMEVIDISGYTDNEKVRITQDYIIPKLMKEVNVPSNKFTLSDEIIRYIIENYTRESGVRDVERKIRELLQKTLLAEARQEQITLTKETIDKYFKHSKYHKQKLQDDEVTIGMINGLAHTARGGDLIKIEASKYKGDGKIKATGKLGEVLKESIDAAMTCLKSGLDSSAKEIGNDILKTHDIHIHLPAGATPKDGPSAGITIYTALYSLLSNKKIRQDIAMTGEITLKGRVLEIGGLKEKLTAAVREGIKEVIIPKNNERDLADIPEEIKTALVIHPVTRASEILGIVFETKISKSTKQKKN